jgi:hypothetical protein
VNAYFDLWLIFQTAMSLVFPLVGPDAMLISGLRFWSLNFTA